MTNPRRDNNKLPPLKQIDPNRIPNKNEVEEMIQKGMFNDDLVSPTPLAEPSERFTLQKKLKKLYP